MKQDTFDKLKESNERAAKKMAAKWKLIPNPKPKRQWRPLRDIDQSGWTNEMRAARADTAIEAFRLTDTPDESHMRDLLCNLMHLCDRDNRDFEAELAWARRGYEDER